jgi:putative oligomerization/nucleic acid binding protein/PH (Pleckstrin Homology) domain-containing protein
MFDQLLNVAKRHLGQRAWPLGDDLDALRSWLGPDERVEHFVRGYDDDERLLWAATPRRLLLVERERFDREVREVSYAEVRGIEQRAGRFGPALALVTTRKTYAIDLENVSAAPDAAVQSFAEYVRERMSASARVWRGEGNPSVTSASPAQPAAIARTERVTALIRELAALRDGGVISEDEFQSEKRKLLVHG